MTDNAPLPEDLEFYRKLNIYLTPKDYYQVMSGKQPSTTLLKRYHRSISMDHCVPKYIDFIARLTDYFTPNANVPLIFNPLAGIVRGPKAYGQFLGRTIVVRNIDVKFHVTTKDGRPADCITVMPFQWNGSSITTAPFQIGPPLIPIGTVVTSPAVREILQPVEDGTGGDNPAAWLVAPKNVTNRNNIKIMYRRFYTPNGLSTDASVRDAVVDNLTREVTFNDVVFSDNAPATGPDLPVKGAFLILVQDSRIAITDPTADYFIGIRTTYYNP